MTPRFTVVIPAYNAARTVQATIRSVYDQTADEVEIVVVDDGSTDETVRSVREVADSRVTLVRQANAGPSAARNRGIERARGRYVCPLDADDLLFPEFLETMGAALDREDRAGFAYTDAWALDAGTGRVRRASAKAYQRPPRPAPRDRRTFLQALLDRNFVLCCTLIRTDVLHEVGGYDEDLRAAEDYELWLRIVANGYRAEFVDGRLAVYREGQPSSNSSDILKMVHSNISVYDRVASRYPVDEELRAQARAHADGLRRVERQLLEPGARPPLRRGAEAVMAARRWALDPWRWHRKAPREVRGLLEATDGEVRAISS